MFNMVCRRIRPMAVGVASGVVAGAFAPNARADTGSSGTWSWPAGADSPSAGASPDAPKIVVVGSTNVDLIAYCPKLPRPGETLMGTNFVQCFGGKGANQAVMASKLGGAVTMVAKVGNDGARTQEVASPSLSPTDCPIGCVLAPFNIASGMGEECKQNYRDCGVDTTHVYTAGPGVPTGVAPITVDETGENVIIVVSGANMELTTEEVGQAAETIASADVVVCQMEVPLGVTQKAMEMARAAGVLTVFNVAPCPVDGQLPAEVYAVTDVLCVNETELQTLAGVTAADGDLDGYKKAAETLLGRGVRCVLVTLGGDGCIVCTSNEGATHVPATPLPKEAVVDTTGAGDAFTGAFAVFSGMGLSIPEAAGRAGQVASLTVQVEGTQPSYPTRDSVIQSLPSCAAPFTHTCVPRSVHTRAHQLVAFA